MVDKIKILIADDHEITRAGLKLLLSYNFNMIVTAEASTGKESYDYCKKYIPDVCLLDIDMPEEDGIIASKKIKKFDNNIKVILLTALNEGNLIDRALLAGADGYLLKTITNEELVEAINNVINGKKVFSKSVLNYIKNKKVTAYSQFTSKPITFTTREQQILKLLAQGKNNKEIADHLNISIHTANKYTSQLRKKTGSNSRTGLVKYADLLD